MRSTSTWMNDSRRADDVPSVPKPAQRAFRVAIHQDQRMDDEVQRQPVPVDLHRHRVDQERHVVVDDFDDRVRGLPAVLLQRRVEHAQPRLARLALARKVPVRQRRAVEIRGPPLREVFRIDLRKIARDDGLESLLLIRRDFGADERDDVVQAADPAVRIGDFRFHQKTSLKRIRQDACGNRLGELLCRDSMTGRSR